MSFNLTRQEARAKWIEALRSGEYQQSTRDLCTLDVAGEPIGHCCLGVACEVYQQHEEGLVTEDHPSGRQRLYSEYGHVTPGVVRDWLGLRNSFGGPDDVISTASLVTLNDRDQKTFAEIADILESDNGVYFV